MNSRQKLKMQYIDKLFQAIPIPRNQISSISGLTNTYIRDLEHGNIVNVPREKLIALAMAINLNLYETDRLLRVFDRADLSPDDIPFFVDAYDNLKLTGAVYPIRDHFAYELACGAIEQHAGDQIIVNDKPTVSLMDSGHRSYTESFLARIHPIHMELIEAIGKKRLTILNKTTRTHKVDLIVCQDHLENYMLRCEDAQERHWRRRHLANMLTMIQSCPNFKLHVVAFGSGLLFTIKYPEADEAPMLCYCAVGAHESYVLRAGRLSGFATAGKVLTQTFGQEVANLRSHVIEKFTDTSILARYIENLIDRSVES